MNSLDKHMNKQIDRQTSYAYKIILKHKNKFRIDNK